MFLLRLALKNIFRKLRRTLITAVSVLVGVLMLILSMAFIDGLDGSVIRGQIRSDSGHFRVLAPGALEAEEENELGPLLEEPQAVRRLLAEERGAELYPRLRFSAQLGDGVHSLRARGFGVEPEPYFQRFALPMKQVLPPEQRPAGTVPIWVGISLAEPLGLRPGSEVTLLTRTRHGAYTAGEYVVAGLVESQNAAVDGATFFLPLDAAQELLDAAGAVNEVAGFLPHSELALELPARHQAALGREGLVLQTWKERAEPTLSLNQVRRRFLMVLVVMVMMVASTSIANTLVMSAFERIREVGTLRALGFQTERVAFLFLMEALFIGVIGALGGLLLGVAALHALRDGLDLSAVAASGNVAVSMSTKVYMELSRAQLALALLIGWGVTMVAALYPSIKFSRLSALEAMKR